MLINWVNLHFFSETGDSRPILRRLDRVIGLPEEGALMLRDYEHLLFGHTSVEQLLKGLAKVLNRDHDETNHIQDILHFQKLVSHFYLVRLFSQQDCWKLVFRIGCTIHYLRLKYWMCQTFTFITQEQKINKYRKRANTGRRRSQLVATPLIFKVVAIFHVAFMWEFKG